MPDTNHLEEARDSLKQSRDEDAPEWALVQAQRAIAHALIAIAERMPIVRHWRCCNRDCRHEWDEAAQVSPQCPLCGQEGAPVNACIKCPNNDRCWRKKEQEG